ncbi:MAG: FlgD immunoglobulin-like domain containing protein, partial [Elusimicrobiota bacterium]
MAFLLLTAFPAGLRAEFSGWITEISYDETGGQDWIELYIIENGDVQGAKVFHSYYQKESTCVKVLPQITANKGEYIVVHLNDSSSTPDETSSTGDKNANGYWDVYSPFKRGDYGISGTAGAFWVTKTDGISWADFVIYADQNESSYWGPGGDARIVYSSATYYNQWNPDESGSWDTSMYESNAFDSTGYDKGGLSFQRKGGADGNPEDTDTKADWEMAATSKGEGYFIPQVISGRLKITNSPFFPHGDNTSQASVGSITYKLDSVNYNVTIAVYDINGYVVKYLLHDYPVTSGEGGLTWNGYDEMGNVVPTGIYIVQL